MSQFMPNKITYRQIDAKSLSGNRNPSYFTYIRGKSEKERERERQ